MIALIALISTLYSIQYTVKWIHLQLICSHFIMIWFLSFETLWMRCCWVLRWLVGLELQLSTSIIVQQLDSQPTLRNDSSQWDAELAARHWLCCRSGPGPKLEGGQNAQGSARDDDWGKQPYNIDCDNNIATALMNEWDVKGHDLEKWAV